MIHYNLDCDFKIAEPLYADAPFRYTYYAKSEKTVVAEYDGTDYHGCYPMDDMLIVPINAGSLGLGEVKVRREYYLTDKDFTDGICNRVTGNVPLGIEIWRGETDGMETHEVKVVPAYQKGDPFTFDDMTDAQKQDIANRVPTKEPEREKAEVKREQNELLRQANEAIRQENETKRVDAEISREERTAEAIASIANKVDRDDNAPKLTAGFANNLIGRGEATPQEISFRPSGGDTSIEDGTARIDKVKGSTVVWNQLAKINNADTFLTTSSIRAHYGLKYSRPNIIHKYIAKGTIKAYNNDEPISTSYVYLGVGTGIGNFNQIISNITTNKEFAVFFTPNREDFNHIIFYVLGSPVEGDGWGMVDIVIYDLTQMFGAGNEPTTIEEFNARKPIGIDEYAYNEGELISTNVDEIKSVGFNAWDEEWEGGIYSTTNGNKVSISGRWRCKNLIPVLPNTKYYKCVKSGGSVRYGCYYDKDKNFVSRHDCSNNNVFTTPSNAHYLTIYCEESYGATYKGDICIHLAHTGYRNGEYEPYKEFRRSIPIKDIKDKDGNQLFPNGLLSAGSVYDEVTATKAIKRIGVVDMGSLQWKRYSPSKSFWRASLKGAKDLISGEAYANCVCIRYNAVRPKDVDDNVKGVSLGAPGFAVGGHVLLYDPEYVDNSVPPKLQGVMLYYELAEPIEVDLAEPLNLDYEVSDFGTEEVISDVPTTPMKADIIYQFNAVDRIRDNSRHTAEADAKLLDYESRIAALEAIVASLTSSES